MWEVSTGSHDTIIRSCELCPVKLLCPLSVEHRDGMHTCILRMSHILMVLSTDAVTSRCGCEGCQQS